MIAMVGFLPPDDPRVRGTIAAIEGKLVHDGFVMRYNTGAGVDGLPPGEGSFLTCSVLFRVFHAYSPSFLAVTALAGFFTASFYGWLPQYLPELYPTRVRATGQGVCYNFGRILTAVCTWKMGTLMAWFGGSYAHAGEAVAYIYVIGIAAIWFLPETIGRPLPD